MLTGLCFSAWNLISNVCVRVDPFRTPDATKIVVTHTAMPPAGSVLAAAINQTGVDRTLRFSESVTRPLATVTKPLVADVTLRPHWRLTCSDNMMECFGELIIFFVLLACALIIGVWYCRRYGRSPASKDEKVALFEAEDGDVEVALELGDGLGGAGCGKGEGSASSLSSMGGTHRRSQSWDTNDGDDEYADLLSPSLIPSIFRKGRRSKRRPRRKSSRSGWSVDDYAPKLSEVVAAVEVAAAAGKKWAGDAAKGAARLSREEGEGGGESEEAKRPSNESEELPPDPAPAHAAAGGGVDVPTGSCCDAASDVPSSSSAAATTSASGAPPSDAGPRSSVHAVSVAWRRVLLADGGGLAVEPLLEALEAAVSLCELFGPLMAPAAKNDRANTDKVRSAWIARGRLPTLRGLLDAEVASGLHGAAKGNGQPRTLKDPSAAVALVWVRRSLAFQTHVLGGLASDRSSSLSAVAGEAYKTTLEKFHTWLLKSTFRMGLNAMPTRGEFLKKLSEGEPRLKSRPDAERERICYDDLAELAEVQAKVVEQVMDVLSALQLEMRTP